MITKPVMDKHNIWKSLPYSFRNDPVTPHCPFCWHRWRRRRQRREKAGEAGSRAAAADAGVTELLLSLPLSNHDDGNILITLVASFRWCLMLLACLICLRLTRMISRNHQGHPRQDKDQRSCFPGTEDAGTEAHISPYAVGIRQSGPSRRPR